MKVLQNKPFIGVNIVPTGIGASIGGFAGDAAPSNKLLASCCDRLIFNPNVVNAATMFNIPSNGLYVEGYSINSFFKRDIALRESCGNRIGVIFDLGIPEEVFNINLNAIGACKSVLGINVSDIKKTSKPLDITFSKTTDGLSFGTIGNPQTLLDACFHMLKLGVDAMAIVGYFHKYEYDDEYSNGFGADPIGMIEAVISHLVSHEFNVPCAHAPAFQYDELLPSKKIVYPGAASEYFSPTFLPCVLAGLSNSPKIIPKVNFSPFDILIDDVAFLVTPYDCLGNIPVLNSLDKDISIIAVKGNKTLLDVTCEKLNLDNKIINVANYLEACGVISALRLGINIDSVINRG